MGEKTKEVKPNLTNLELQVTQKIQLHFPRGKISSEILKFWDNCLSEIIEQKLFEAFGTIPGDPILRLLSKGQSIIIEKCDGKETLAQAKEVFKSGIDSFFTKWELDKAGKETEAIAVQVHEIIQDSTFAEMFGSLGIDLDELCLTQNQIKLFCKNHSKWLRDGVYGTFFLFKKDENKPSTPDNIFVSLVSVDSGGLSIDVRRLSRNNVWGVDCLHRLVVPQQVF